MNADRNGNGKAGVTVRRYGLLTILEPAIRGDGRGSVFLTPSWWTGVRAAVDTLRERARIPTRGLAALAMLRAGIGLEETLEPATGASRLIQRQLDVARALAAEPRGIVLRGFFSRLGEPASVALMRALRDIAVRGVACYVLAEDDREADTVAAAARRVFAGMAPGTLRLRFA